MGYVTNDVTRQASHHHPTALTRLFIKAVRRDLADLNPDLLHECWTPWQPRAQPNNEPTIDDCNIIQWNDTTQEAMNMEWDQRTMDPVTSNKVHITNSILLN
eukprot:468392-Heterocapsa_arctica.AAC.1